MKIHAQQPRSVKQGVFHLFDAAPPFSFISSKQRAKAYRRRSLLPQYEHPRPSHRIDRAADCIAGIEIEVAEQAK